MISEDYYGFQATTRSSKRLLGRTQLSAEKRSNSKSREKYNIDQIQLEKLKEKYNGQNKIKSSKRKSSTIKYTNNLNVQMNDLKFRYYHYYDNGYNTRHRQVKKRVEKTALQTLQRSLTPQSQLSVKNGLVDKKYSKQLQQNMTSRKSSRQIMGCLTENSKFTKNNQNVSNRNISSESKLRQASSLSHRTYRPLNYQQKSKMKIENNQQNGYRLNPYKETEQVEKMSSNLILGTQTIRKIKVEYEQQTISPKKIIQYKQQTQLMEISLNSKNDGQSQIQQNRSSRISETKQQMKVLGTSDYDLIKQMVENAKLQSLQLNPNKNIQFNNIQTIRSTVQQFQDPNSYRTSSNKTSTNRENMLSNLINNEFPNANQVLNAKVMQQQRISSQNKQTTKNQNLFPLEQENTLQFILNSQIPSNKNVHENLSSPYFNKMASQQSGLQDNMIQSSSLDISKSSNKNVNTSYFNDNDNQLRMSIGQTTPTQPRAQRSMVSIEDYDKNFIPRPPNIFQRPSQQNILMNSFNLLDQLKQINNIEERKIVDLYSTLGIEGPDLQIVMDRIYDHFSSLNKISDFIQDTQHFYIDSEQRKLFHQCSFMLLKKYYQQRQKAVLYLKQGKSCFHLTGKQISDEQIKNINYTNALKQFCNQIQQSNKQLWEIIQKFYITMRYEGLPSIILNRKELTKQNLYYIMQKLNEELELLVHKIDENEYKNIYHKDNQYEVISMRCFSIMELTFLLSELQGRKIKKLQNSIQPQQFELYCKENYGNFKQTVLYFH